MIFFADENFMCQGAKLLEAFDPTHEIRVLTDYFERGTPDTQWMKKIAQWSPPPVVIGGDSRILKNKVERQTLTSCNLMFVLLASGWTNLDWPAFAWKIVKVWPDIVRNVKRTRRPSIFEVKPNNLKVCLVRPTS